MHECERDSILNPGDNMMNNHSAPFTKSAKIHHSRTSSKPNSDFFDNPKTSGFLLRILSISNQSFLESLDFSLQNLECQGKSNSKDSKDSQNSKDSKSISESSPSESQTSESSLEHFQSISHFNALDSHFDSKSKILKSHLISESSPLEYRLILKSSPLESSFNLKSITLDSKDSLCHSKHGGKSNLSVIDLKNAASHYFESLKNALAWQFIESDSKKSESIKVLKYKIIKDKDSKKPSFYALKSNKACNNKIYFKLESKSMNCHDFVSLKSRNCSIIDSKAISESKQTLASLSESQTLESSLKHFQSISHFNNLDSHLVLESHSKSSGKIACFLPIAVGRKHFIFKDNVWKML